MKEILVCVWLVLSAVLLMSSCEDYVEIDAPNAYVIGDEVFANEELAIAAVEGLYHQLYANGSFASGGQQSVSVLAGLSADELLAGTYFLDMGQFQNNEIIPSNNYAQQLWSSAYNGIYMANAILEGLENSEDIDTGVTLELMGEAKFLRAFTYFNLVNLFGDVPLILGTDYRENAVLTRDSVNVIYEQIVADLQYAREHLTESYRGGEHIRANRLAASAMLARVHLYLENWEEAETYASEVISSSLYHLEPDLDSVFLSNSQEAIWQLAPNNAGNTNEGNLFILLQAPPNSFLYPVYLDNTMVDDFTPEDLRLSHWIGVFESGGDHYYYPYKYKVRLSTSEPTEYSTVLRLSEQYLIRSESQIQQGKLQQGLSDLNVVRMRAGLSELSMDVSSELLDALFVERRRELFTEWGHRWFDLIRSDRIENELSPKKPMWQATDALYPIPEQELGRVPNMEQNEGY